jgi:copper chaperone CopZ
MRILMLVVSLFMLAGAGSTLAAQGRSQQQPSASKGRTATVVILTSAQCGMCKTTIERGLGQLAGVQSAVLNVSSKRVKVRYYRNETNPDAIRAHIASLGYSADGVAANPDAYQNLPACCQLPGTGGGKHSHHR